MSVKASFENNFKLLKFARARIESKSAERELRARAEGFIERLCDLGYIVYSGMFFLFSVEVATLLNHIYSVFSCCVFVSVSLLLGWIELSMIYFNLFSFSLMQMVSD